MISLVMVAGLVVGSVLQALWPAWSAMGQAKPPVLLGLVLYYALNYDRRLMLQGAILAGLLQDALGLIPLGYSSFGFCLVGLAIGRFKEQIFVQQWFTHVLLGSTANGALTLLLFVLLAAKDGAIGYPVSWLLLKTTGAVLLGALVVPLVVRVLGTADLKLGNLTAPLR